MMAKDQSAGGTNSPTVNDPEKAVVGARFTKPVLQPPTSWCAEEQDKVNTRADFEAQRDPYEAVIKRALGATKKVCDLLPILSQPSDWEQVT